MHAPLAAAAPGFFEVWILGGGGAGFIFLLPLQALLLAAIACAVRAIAALSDSRVLPPGRAAQLAEDLAAGAASVSPAPDALGQIVQAALEARPLGPDAARDAADAAIEERTTELIRHPSWLALIGGLAPMLGLLGTVVGMVLAFTKIAVSSQAPPPAALAGGIYAALVSTVWGLLVAIPALGTHFLLRNRAQRLATALSLAAGPLIDLAVPRRAADSRR